jgi:hypothetical protein
MKVMTWHAPGARFANSRPKGVKFVRRVSFKLQIENQRGLQKKSYRMQKL